MITAQPSLFLYHNFTKLRLHLQANTKEIHLFIKNTHYIYTPINSTSCPFSSRRFALSLSYFSCSLSRKRLTTPVLLSSKVSRGSAFQTLQGLITSNRSAFSINYPTKPPNIPAFHLKSCAESSPKLGDVSDHKKTRQNSITSQKSHSQKASFNPQ